jgi:hypothetical protein
LPGEHQDVVRVVDAFAQRPRVDIEEDVRGWIAGHAKNALAWVEQLRNEEQRQGYSTPEGALEYHLFVYFDSQPSVLIAKGAWDSMTKDIRVEVYRAKDIREH